MKTGIGISHLFGGAHQDGTELVCAESDRSGLTFRIAKYIIASDYGIAGEYRLNSQVGK